MALLINNLYGGKVGTILKIPSPHILSLSLIMICMTILHDESSYIFALLENDITFVDLYGRRPRGLYIL